MQHFVSLVGQLSMTKQRCKKVDQVAQATFENIINDIRKTKFCRCQAPIPPDVKHFPGNYATVSSEYTKYEKKKQMYDALNEEEFDNVFQQLHRKEDSNNNYCQNSKCLKRGNNQLYVKCPLGHKIGCEKAYYPITGVLQHVKTCPYFSTENRSAVYDYCSKKRPDFPKLYNFEEYLASVYEDAAAIIEEQDENSVDESNEDIVEYFDEETFDKTIDANITIQLTEDGMVVFGN